jgi:hypothetical protein
MNIEWAIVGFTIKERFGCALSVYRLTYIDESIKHICFSYSIRKFFGVISVRLRKEKRNIPIFIPKVETSNCL